MSEAYWTRILQDAKMNGRPVVIALKQNMDVEAEGHVVEIGVMPGIVAIKNRGDAREVCSYVLLGEIAAVGVMKGEDD
jgi:hypothetical protein